MFKIWHTDTFDNLLGEKRRACRTLTFLEKSGRAPCTLPFSKHRGRIMSEMLNKVQDARRRSSKSVKVQEARLFFLQNVKVRNASASCSQSGIIETPRVASGRDPNFTRCLGKGSECGVRGSLGVCKRCRKTERRHCTPPTQTQTQTQTKTQTHTRARAMGGVPDRKKHDKKH